MGCHSSKLPAKALIPLRSPISVNSLKNVIDCLLEKNKEVVRIILDCKKVIRKKPELLLLVKDYFDKGLHTLDFCTALDNCLKNAQNTQLFLQRALLHLDESDPTIKCEKAIEELKLFKECVNIFAKEFLEDLQLVHEQQLSLLETLRLKKKRLDKKLKSLQAWKKLLFIIFASTSAVLLISSIVAAIVGAHPIAAAIFAACSAMGEQFNSMWNKYMDAIKREKKILSALKYGASVAINEIDVIQYLVNTLRDENSSLLENVEFDLSDEGAVRFLIEEIGKKMELFTKNIEDLVPRADHCRRGRTAVYEKLVNTPPDAETEE